MTQVASKKVVSLAFVLKDKNGEVLEEADAEAPLVYLHGVKTLPPGIEAAVEGMGVGEKKDVVIPAADAFGERDENRIEKVGRHKLGKSIKPRKGDVLRIQTDKGVLDATVVNVTQVTVTLDLNHPLAGVDLHSSFHVLDIRDATEEEIAHGHAHGHDGHDHDHGHAHDHGHDHGHDHDHSHGHDHK